MFDDIVKEKFRIKPGVYVQEYEKLEIPLLDKKYPELNFTVEKTPIEPKVREIKAPKVDINECDTNIVLPVLEHFERSRNASSKNI